MWRVRFSLVVMVGGLVLFGACVQGGASPSPEATATAMPVVPSPVPRITATVSSSPRRVVVCATEPEAASPFAPSASGDALLSLFYEPPLERHLYRWEPRLVTHLPTLATGDVVTRMVMVPVGGRYVDLSGAVRVHEGPQPRVLPQMVVTFTLREGVRWSDGELLTAKDVLLGYHLAQSVEARGPWRALVERTSRFTAVNERMLRWEGVPGYLTTDYARFLFPPQPAHRWQGWRLQQVLQDRTPPATGPFQIVAWEGGREVRLRRNPHYVGATPRLDEVVFRFLPPSPEVWPSLLADGRCDLMTAEAAAQVGRRQWEGLQAQGKVRVWEAAAPVLVRLDLNLAPEGGEPSPLEDRQVRHALATCLDRQRLGGALPTEVSLPAEGFFPPGYPVPPADERVTYDPRRGMAMLSAAGWRDEDGDGVREAHGVAGFEDGTPLSLTLHLAPQYFVLAAYIAADLEQCGVAVTPVPTEVQLLYAADAVSPLFGRTFQMVLFGWQVQLPQVCGSWLSERMPTEANGWEGENFGGYSSAGYDGACRRALRAVDVRVMDAALQEAQAYLLHDLPTIFIAWRPVWFVASPRLHGLQPDASAPSMFWNAEVWDREE